MTSDQIRPLIEHLEHALQDAHTTRQAAAQADNPHWLTLLIAILEAALSFLKNFPTQES
jgi:hypothetical protein